MTIIDVIKGFFRESEKFVPSEDCDYCGGTGLDPAFGVCYDCEKERNDNQWDQTTD